MWRIEELDAGARRRSVEPGLDLVAALRHHLRDHADPGPILLDPSAVARGDQPTLQRVAVDADDLHDLGLNGPGDVVELAEPRDLVGGGTVGRRPLDAVRVADPRACEVDDRAAVSPARSAALAASAASSRASRSSRFEYA